MFAFRTWLRRFDFFLSASLESSTLAGARKRRGRRGTPGALRASRLLAPRIEPLECRTLLSVTVATEAASGVMASGATLNGTVNPGGSAATAYFQYSTAPTFTPTVEATIGSGLFNPNGVAVDTLGDVFVADTANNAVKEVLANRTIKTIGSGFADPSSVAVDSAGDVFVADQLNNAVKEVLTNGTIKTIGSGFSDPAGVAVDEAGDVFVADFNNNAVKEVLANGTIKTIGSGFSFPSGVAVDAAGDVFVADTSNSAVKEVLASGKINTIGSGFGFPSGVAVDAVGDVFVAANNNDAVKEILPNGTVDTIGSGFSIACGVAVDAAGDVFVADTDHNRVVEVSPPTVAATPLLQTNSTAQQVSGALTGLTAGTTYYFRSVAVSAGGTVADTQSPPESFTTLTPPSAQTSAANAVSASGAILNGSVNPHSSPTTAYFQYSADPKFTPTVVTTIGSGFSSPEGVALDGAGDVFVADNNNHAVKEILANGTVNTIATGFQTAAGVAVDAAGDVFVADYGTNTIKEILPNGTIKTIGSGFNQPIGVALDSAGDVFVADTLHNVVKEVLTNGTTKTIGSGFVNPNSVALDAAGDVFVADYGNNAVKEILIDGTIKTIGSGFDEPAGLAVDTAGDVFVSDQYDHTVKEALPNGTINTIGSGFKAPAGVAVDAAGDVFAADSGTNGVVEVSPATVAARPSLVSGSSAQQVSAAVTGLTAGTTYYFRVVAASSSGTVADTQSPPESFATLALPSVQTSAAKPVSATGATLNGTVNPNGLTTTAYFQYSTDAKFTPTVESPVGSGFAQPNGVAVDAAGDVFVADTLHSAVKEVLPNGTIKTIGSGFLAPNNVAVDSTGDVFVADSLNNAVKEVLSNGTVNTIGSGFNDPSGVAVDAAGDVFVADFGNSAVEEVLPNGTVNIIGSGFANPTGVAVDLSGDVFVGDTFNNAVKEVLPNGTIKTIGSGFHYPLGVAVDTIGDVFVADGANNAIKEILPNGTTQTIASGFSNLADVAVDAVGDIFAADFGSNQVIELSPGTTPASPSPLTGSIATAVSDTLTGLTPATTYYYRAVAVSADGTVADMQSPPESFTTLATPNAQTSAAKSVSATGATLNGSVNPHGLATAAYFQYSTNATFTPIVETTIASGFNVPIGVAVDAAGDVFVADSSHNAIEEVLPGGTIKTVGSGFNNPAGIAVDASGDVLVADYGNNAVEEILTNGTIKTIGSGFSQPYNVAVDAAGDVFVADYQNSAVKEVLPNGTIKTIGSGFNYPMGVAVDTAGDVFVADTFNNAVEEVLPNGTIKTIGTGFFNPGGVAVDAAGDVFVADYGYSAVKEILPNGTIKTIGSGFSSASTVALDAAGDVFVADSGNNRIIKVSPAMVAATQSPLIGSTVQQVSAAMTGLTAGTTYYFRVVAANADGTAADLQSPPESFTTLTPPSVQTSAANAISATGATLNGTVNPQGSMATAYYQYSTDPTFEPTVQTIVDTGSIRYPSGVALDAAGDVFVVSMNNAVTEFLTNGTIKTIGSGFNNPMGIAVDAAGDVFVADTNDSAVKEVLPSGTIKTIGSGFIGPKGVAVDAAGDVFVADDGYNNVLEILPNGTIKAVGSGFNYPMGVAVDTAGDVFVADTSHNAVKEVLPNGTIKTIGSGFFNPASVAVDAAGDVFVADTNHNAVNEVLPNGTINTIGSGFFFPLGMAVDTAGDLFVADTDNNRVVKVSPPTVAATPSPLNSPDAQHVSAAVTGLTAGTTYYFRVVAASTGGTVADTANPPESFTTPSITWASPADITYGAALGATQLDATASIPGSFTYTLADGTTPAAGAVLRAGQNQVLNVTFTPADSADYAIDTAQVQINVDRAPLTIAADDKSKIYGAALPTLTAIFSGFVNGDSAANLTTPPSLSTTATASSHVSGKPYAITASGAVDSDYTISYVAGGLTVTPAALTITADDKSKVYGAALPTLTASFSGFVNGDSAASLTTPPSLSTTATASSHVSGKPYAITASGAVDADYTISYFPGTLIVTPAALTIAAEDKSKIYGAALPTLTASFSGFVNGDGVSSLTTPPSLSTTATAVSHVSGSPYPIKASGAVDADYTISYFPGTLIITPATLTIIADDKTEVYGTPLPTLTASYSGFVNGDSASVISGEASLSTTATTASGVGSYPIVAAQGTLTAADYIFAFQNGTLTMAANSQGAFGLVEDVYVIGSGTVSVSATNGVLANDTGPGQLAVVAGTVTGAEGGTFTFNADGSFTYTPPSNFPGFDYAKYTATDAAGDHASATVDVLSQSGGVVWKFYESVLHRDPDYAGLQHWINDFASGGKTGDIAVGFFESDELLTQVITGYYEQYLLRAPDASGLAHWKAVWGDNGGPEKIRAFFAESAELYTSAGGTPDAWINALYQRILARTPDANGEQHWLDYYQQQVAGVDPAAVRYNIALFFLTSSEGYGDDVSGWFDEYLLRAPTDTALQQYTKEMLSGETDRQIEQEITNLPEYGQNPPAATASTAQGLPDYYQPGSSPSSRQATVAAKDAVFSQLGN